MYLCSIALQKAGCTFQDIAAIAVSINPSLLVSLIDGLAFAKSLAWSIDKPLITVNHLLSHIFANYIDHAELEPPFLALVVSGGHTEMVHFKTETEFYIIGKTLDDAAGETFDKTAKLMGLPFPGGPIIDKLAKNGNPSFVELPRALPQKDNYNFSYSGLKTAVRTYINSLDHEYLHKYQADIAASVQAAIVDPLVKKSIRWTVKNGTNKILLAGGVAANSALRHKLTAAAASHRISVFYPSLPLCMDNAAMVAAAAVPKFKKELFSKLSVNAYSLKGTKL